MRRIRDSESNREGVRRSGGVFVSIMVDRREIKDEGP